MVPQLKTRLTRRRQIFAVRQQQLDNEQVLLQAVRKANQMAAIGDPPFAEYERRRIGWLKRTLDLVEADRHRQLRCISA